MLNKKHIKAPRVYNPPGRHTPPETLAYLNEAEHEMLRMLTDGEASRGPNGVRSYAITTSAKGPATVSTGSMAGRSTGPGGGSLQAPARTAPSTNVGGSKSNSVAGGGGSSKSTTSSIGSAASAQAASKAKASSSSSAPKSPAAPSGSTTKSTTSAAPKSLSGIGSPTAMAPTRQATVSGGGGKAAPAPSVTVATPPSRPLGGNSFNASKSPTNKEKTSSNAPAAMSKTKAPAVGMTPTGYVQQNLRGPLGPNAEMRKGITPSTDTYRVAQVAQGLYDKFGKMKTQDVDTFVRNYTSALPGESAINLTKNRNEQAQRMRDLARIGVNQALNVSTDKVMRGIDTYNIPSLQKAGKKSLGLVSQSSELASRARDAVVDAMTRPGTVSPAARSATNFTAPGTPLSAISPKLQKLGETGAGNFGLDPAYAKRTEKANTEAQRRLGGAPAAPNKATPSAMSLPQGALSPNPNYGSIVTPGAPTRNIPGRFGTSLPVRDDKNATLISTGPGKAIPTNGAITMENKYSHRFEDDYEVPDANRFDRTITNPGLYNEAGVRMVGYDPNRAGKTFDPNELNADGEKLYQAIVDTALRTGTPIGFFSGTDQRGVNHVGHAMDMNIRDPNTGAYLGGVRAPTERNAKAYEGDYKNFADAVFDTAYQNPDVYGNVGPRTRWGGNFRQGVPGDYMHFDVTPGGGFSAPQMAMHQAARSRASEPTDASTGLLTASYDPASASVMKPAMANLSNTVKPPGITGGLRKLGEVVRGDYKIPNMIPDANPTFKSFAEAGPLKRAAMSAGFSAMYGDKVRGYASDAIKAMQSALTPSSPPKKDNGPPKSLSGIGSPNEDKKGKKGSKDKKSSTPSAIGSRSAESGKRDYLIKKPVGGGGGGKKAQRTDEPPPVVVTPPPSNFMTTESKEAVLRRLLGEDWYKS